jgi:hypothetical protein
MGSNRFWHIVSVVKERLFCLPVLQSGYQRTKREYQTHRICQHPLTLHSSFPHFSTDESVTFFPPFLVSPRPIPIRTDRISTSSGRLKFPANSFACHSYGKKRRGYRYYRVITKDSYSGRADQTCSRPVTPGAGYIIRCRACPRGAMYGLRRGCLC